MIMVALFFYVVMSTVQKKRKTQEKPKTSAERRRLKVKRIMKNMKIYSLHQHPSSICGDLLLIPLRKEDVRVEYERSLDSADIQDNGSVTTRTTTSSSSSIVCKLTLQDETAQTTPKSSRKLSKLKSGLHKMKSLVRVPSCFGIRKKGVDISSSQVTLSIDVVEEHACESTCDIQISTTNSIKTSTCAHCTCTHTPHGGGVNEAGGSEERSSATGTATESSAVPGLLNFNTSVPSPHDQLDDTDFGTYTEAPTSTIHTAASSILDMGEPITKICAGIECPICIQPFRPGDQIFKLPVCGHLTHSNCGLSWLVKRPYCPVCKHEVIPSSTTRGGGHGSVNRGRNARENRRRSEHTHAERSRKRTSHRRERPLENEA